MKQSIYPILDVDTCKKRGLDPLEIPGHWMDLGLNLFQLRWKGARESEYLALARRIQEAFPDAGLIANDFARIALRNFLLVHVGQEDWRTEGDFLREGHVAFGISTHSPQQLKEALLLSPGPAYVALGPVRPTSSKPTGTDPVLSGEELEEAVAHYARTAPPCGLVLIGGIKADNLEGIVQPISERHKIVPAVALIQAALDPEELRRIHAILERLPGRRAGLERSLTTPGAT